MNLVGLFSGIGGLELPFHRRGAKSLLMCDVWDASQKVLKQHFPDTDIKSDVSKIKSLPSRVDVITAGFPCTDLSQAGQTAGISGNESGLVSHVFRLIKNRKVEWLILENVRNMLVLDKGKAMSYLTDQLENMGFRWAYRLVDSRFSGVPQRRHRVLFVASKHHDPRQVLFSDDTSMPPEHYFRDDAYGFYWTEGLRGLGWAKDAIPPLKGGSSLGIPSPPAIWIPSAEVGSRLVTPSIGDADILQGFPRGWTEPADTGKSNSPRWKLVGNAVSVGVSDWLVDRIYNPGNVVIENSVLTRNSRWPDAAYGEKGKKWKFEASHWPLVKKYNHLLDTVRTEDLKPLSNRAAAGFFERASRSSLRFQKAFLTDIRLHINSTHPVVSRTRITKLTPTALTA